MSKGYITKGIGGFYYVHDGRSRIYECRARGVFRSRKIKPLVGDRVEFEVLSDTEGNVTEILPRKNQLIRPAVANVDQALVIFAAAKPKPNFNLLDRFLILMQYQQVPAVVCFNKQDLAGDRELPKDLRASHSLRISAATGEGLPELRGLLERTIQESRVLVERVYPYAQAGDIARVRRYGQIVEEEYREDGIYIRAWLPRGTSNA